MPPRYKKRKDKRYQKLVNVGKRPDGSYHRVPAYGYSYEELEEDIKRIEALHNAGFDFSDRKPTVKEWADKWLEVYKAELNRSQRSNYRSLINVHLKEMHNVSIDKVRQVDLQKVLKAAHDSLSQSIVDKLYNGIVGIFSTAKKNGLTATDLTADLNKPTGGKKVKRDSLSEVEIGILAATCKEHEYGLLPMVMMYAGLRFGEALALTYGDLQGGYVNVDKTVVYEKNSNAPSVKYATKTEAGIRKVPIVPPLEPFIEEHIARFGADQLKSNYVFLRDGRLFSATMRKRTWRSIMEAYNAKWEEEHTKTNGDLVSFVQPRKFTAHMLRHTFVSIMYDADVDIKTAQKWAGHSTAAILMDTYTHLSEKKEEDAETKIRQHFIQGKADETEKPVSDEEVVYAHNES